MERFGTFSSTLARRWIKFLLCAAVLGLALVVSAQEAEAPQAPAEFRITKGLLQGRIEDLQRAREQAIANANAMAGAIQECEFWLRQLEEAERKAKEKPQLEPK